MKTMIIQHVKPVWKIVELALLNFLDIEKIVSRTVNQFVKRN